MEAMNALKAMRGPILDILKTVDCPEEIEANVRYIEDGLLLVRGGRFEWVGTFEEGRKLVPEQVRIRDYRGKLMVPGFVDTHIHYPQAEMVGAYGEQLLEWLNNYTFPAERRYKDPEYAKEMSSFFLKQLLRNGTTTAMVFGTVHPESIEALFHEAEKHHMRLIAGKVMMDRNAPDYLRDTPETSYRESKELIEKWHNKGRLLYAVTPALHQPPPRSSLRRRGVLSRSIRMSICIPT